MNKKYKNARYNRDDKRQKKLQRPRVNVDEFRRRGLSPERALEKALKRFEKICTKAGVFYQLRVHSRKWKQKEKEIMKRKFNAMTSKGRGKKKDGDKRIEHM